MKNRSALFSMNIDQMWYIFIA